MMYFLRYQGQNHGPYALDQIRSMWASGIITADAVYWVQAASVWKPIADLIVTARSEAASTAAPAPMQEHAAGEAATTVPPRPQTTNAESLRYAGFWPRLISLLLDFLIYLPLGLLAFWGYLNHRLFALYYLIPGTLFGIFFNVYLVQRFGGTPGKLIAGIHIRKVDGKAVSYREAFLRYLPAFIFGLLTSIAMVASVSQISDAKYHSLTFMEQATLKAKFAPSWYPPLLLFNQLWFWGELLVLLTNRKRRSLHDFIAGTVVIQASPVTKREPEGVEGWLGFYCVSLIALIPTAIVFSVIIPFQLIDVLRPVNRAAANWLDTRMAADAVILFAQAIFSIVAGILLVRRTRNAVLVAKVFTATLPVMALAGLFADLSGGAPGDVRDYAVISGIKSLIQSLGFFAIWFTYLCRSRRVRNTYGGEADAPTSEDEPEKAEKSSAEAPEQVQSEAPVPSPSAEELPIGEADFEQTTETPASPPVPPPASWSWELTFGVVLAIGVVIFIVVQLVTSFESARQPAKRGGLSESSPDLRDATTLFKLGHNYANGIGVPKDEVEAARWYRKAADQGEAAAQNNLGVMFANGIGVPKDEVEAARWYQKAADQGVAAAQNNLGAMFANGIGVPKDEVEAARWYRKAADIGYAPAQINLGFMYAEGKWVPKDDAYAVEWYRKAAAQGNARALFNLGYMYSKGLGVARDDAKAVEIWKNAAEQGHALAQCSLGYAYDAGQGVIKDSAKAAEWYQKAADQGDATAQRNLGGMLAGWGFPKDDAKAVELYKKAAVQGDPDAINRLGNMYLYGLGIPKDAKKAVECYERAAVLGDPFAQGNLGNMYNIGEGVTKSYTKAVEWFQKAAENGHAQAQYNLGFMYSNGRGVEKDQTKALAWYQKAAAQGDANAQAALRNNTGTAQQRAVQLYPELGVAGSPFNREFVARHNRYKDEKPSFFNDTEWPTKLAAECAKVLGKAARQ